jgi:hypothetical protein
MPEFSLPRKIKSPWRELPGAGERRLGKVKRLFYSA